MAGCEWQVAREQIGQRRFARAIGPNDCMNFAFAQIDRHFVHGSQATKLFGNFVGAQQQVVR
jgi:hypothetical protein